MAYADTANHHAITQAVLAARSVGMSYGQYVQRTGGALEPPEELKIEADPKALICRNCGKKFRSPNGHYRVYCSDACRIAWFDKNRKEKKRHGKE